MRSSLNTHFDDFHDEKKTFEEVKGVTPINQLFKPKARTKKSKVEKKANTSTKNIENESQ